jgi:hypothetical protein
VLEDMGVKRLTYLYDYGDGWERTIRIERIGEALPGELYPRLLDASGRCPPEDIGGPPGYAEFLEAMADRRLRSERRQCAGDPTAAHRFGKTLVTFQAKALASAVSGIVR